MALQTLATRQGRDLSAEGVAVVAMGGTTNTRAFAERYGPHGLGLSLAGLYGRPGRDHPAARAGGGGPDHRTRARRPGRPRFHACTADLEDELVRALGLEAVEAVITAAGEAQSLRLLAGMPAQHGWTREAVLRRFLTSRSGRKARYAALFVEALEPVAVPAPLSAVLSRV